MLDVQAGLVDQRLRHVAADAAVAGGRAVDADALAEQQPGVAVAGRQQVDHADGVDGLEHPGVGGLARGLGHQVDGFFRVLLQPPGPHGG